MVKYLTAFGHFLQENTEQQQYELHLFMSRHQLYIQFPMIWQHQCNLAVSFKDEF